MMTGTCAGCHFWLRFVKTSSNQDRTDFGECRRYPKVINLEAHTWMFPPHHESDVCGEWQSKMRGVN